MEGKHINAESCLQSQPRNQELSVGLSPFGEDKTSGEDTQGNHIIEGYENTVVVLSLHFAQGHNLQHGKDKTSFGKILLGVVIDPMSQGVHESEKATRLLECSSPDRR
jgi:hypothetical protein